MKFLFMQKSGLPWHGIMSLSAHLKHHGHQTDLILTDEHGRGTMRLVKKFKPDMVGFPVITGEHEWVWKLSKEIKERINTEIVVGGPHPTFYPGMVPLHINFKIPGEAEHSLLRLVEGGLVDNKPYPLEQNLDALCMPDRAIYYKYSHLADASTKQFLTGRGCPYQCSFCSNHLLQKLYRGQRFVRRRSPQIVYEEIVQVHRDYGMRSISFTDDVFTLNKTWLREFLTKYKESRLNIPFMCNTRCELVDEELLDMLVDAGCSGLEMGIESGTESIREEILHKGGATNSQIVQAGRLIKRYGLKLKTYNIIGIPGETLNDAVRTIKLNAAMKPDFTACSFLIPYPRYEITKHCDLALQDIPDSIYKPPWDISPRFVNLQTFFFMGVKFPWMIPVIRLLIKLPPNPLFRLGATTIYGWFMSRVHHMSIKDAIRWRKHIKPERV